MTCRFRPLFGILALGLICFLGALQPERTAAQEWEPHAYFQSLQRPDSPNNWLIAPEGFPGDPDAIAPVYQGTAAALQQDFLTLALSSTQARVLEREEGFACLVVETALFGFEDDVCVQFIALGSGRAALAAYSASRTGYWDLGANRARLDDWLAALKEEQ